MTELSVAGAASRWVENEFHRSHGHLPLRFASGVRVKRRIWDRSLHACPALLLVIVLVAILLKSACWSLSARVRTGQSFKTSSVRANATTPGIPAASPPACGTH